MKPDSPVMIRARHAEFGGEQGFYARTSEACQGPMRLSVAGLICKESTFASPCEGATARFASTS